MSLRQAVSKFCSEIGKNPLLVQGAGGNVSWKEENVLWIKASGTWLADAEVDDIFVPVKLGDLKTSLKTQDYTVVPQTASITPLKPSIETLLHALMPHRIVVHVHAIEVLAHLVRNDFDINNYPHLDKTLCARTVEYCKPGAELAKAVANQLNNSPDTQVVFLRNHGVIIGGDSIEAISEILEYMSQLFSSATHFSSPQAPKTEKSLINGIAFEPVSDNRLHALALNPELVQYLYQGWALYPDHIVFLGRNPFVYETIDHAQESLKNNEQLPPVIFIKNVGVIAKKTVNKATIAQLECYYNVVIRQASPKTLQILTSSQIAELIDWDAEQYRMRFAK